MEKLLLVCLRVDESTVTTLTNKPALGKLIIPKFTIGGAY